METNLEVHNKQHLPDYKNGQRNQAATQAASQAVVKGGGAQLPSLLVLGKPVPVAFQIATQREASALRLGIQRRRKEWLAIKKDLVYTQSLCLPRTWHLEALNYCYKLEEQLDTLVALGKQEAHALALIEEQVLPCLSQMPVEVAELRVAELIVQLFVLLGTDEKKQDEFPTEAAATVIVQRFHWMSVNQIAQVFYNIATGQQIMYGKPTMPMVCQWLQEYASEYNASWEAFSYGQHVQSKAEGEGNRGWQLREANLHMAKVHARKEKARDAALYKLEVQSTLANLQAQHGNST